MGHDRIHEGAAKVPFVSASHEILFEDPSTIATCAMCECALEDAMPTDRDDAIQDAVCERCASVVGVIALSQHDLEEEEG